jgi:cytochrome c-type biogenesis protein CcmH/NrfG
LNEKDYQRAIKLFTQALKANPKNLEATFYKGVAELDNQNPYAAAQVFKNNKHRISIKY